MNDANGQPITVGDDIAADEMIGVVVYDFDNRKFAEGFGDWDMPEVEMLGGGKLNSGVMVKTAEAGLIHYEAGTEHSLLKLN